MTTNVRLLALLGLAMPLCAAQAQTTNATSLSATAAPKTEPPALSPTEQTIADIKHPVSWLTWGADLRIRNEYFNNLLTLSSKNPLHEQDYFRFRGRVWASVSPVTNLNLNVRLASEPREWMKEAGYTPMRLTPTLGKVGPDWTEGVFDNLNVQWKNMFDLPLSVTVGRQDLFLGDGWLVGDGTPNDGSWTYFLDSARVTYDLKEQHTLIDAIGILQYAQDDYWMPTIGNNDRYVTDQNEKGAILNVLNTSLPAANLNPYFMYKHDDRINDFKGRFGDNADIYTFGARIFGAFAENWKYSVEGAYQFGEKQDPGIKNALLSPGARTTGFRNISAYGLNSRLTYLFKDKMANQLSLCYEFLSGDDPNTTNDEMFDLLWGRWPRWSEIGLYSYAAETRVGQEANLHRLGPSWTINPTKKMEINTAYYALFAQQQVATRGAIGPFSEDGIFRGHFLSAVLKYKFSKHVSGHLWSEFLFPGDYYTSSHLMCFLRAEVMFTF